MATPIPTAIRDLLNSLAERAPAPSRLAFGKIVVHLQKPELVSRIYDYVVYRVPYVIEDQEETPPRRTPVGFVFATAPRFTDQELAGKAATDVEAMWRARFEETLRAEFSAVVNVYRMNKELFRP